MSAPLAVLSFCSSKLLIVKAFLLNNTQVCRQPNMPRRYLQGELPVV